MSLYASLYRSRDFIRFMIERAHTGPYFKTVVGKGWLILEPFVYMAIYYFLVVIVFRGGSADGVNPFVMLMSGLVHYLFLQKALISSCQAILSQESLLLQVRIEPAALVAVSFGKAVSDFAVTLALFAVAYWWAGPAQHPHLVWYPLCLAVLIVIGWTWSLMLSVLTVFFRDLQNLTSLLLYLLMYTAPVVYAVSFVPELYHGVRVRQIYLLNPIAALFSGLHWSLLGGEAPPLWSAVVVGVFVLLSLVVSHQMYRRLQPGITKAF